MSRVTNHTRYTALLVLLYSLFVTEAVAAPISEIRFEGNEVTKEKVLRQELLIHEGDEINLKRIEKSRQAIMNLGIFKSVTSRLEEDGEGEGTRVLIFTVEERFYLLPIPLLGGSTEEENYNYGIELRHDNLFGLNQRLKIVYETEESIEGTTPSEKKFSLNYRIPRLIDTPYQLSLNAKHTSETVLDQDDGGNTIGSHDQVTNSGGFFISRWIKPGWISQGWTVGAGLGATQKNYRQQIGTSLAFEDSQAIALSSGLAFNDVAQHPYHRSGTVYGYTASVALPDIGSDYDYTRHWLFYRRYQPLDSLDANINSQFRLGFANGQAFNSATYKLGNSSLLRGYENDSIEGEAVMVLNLEYHHHISGYRQLRAVAFADAGNAWESFDDIDFSDLPVGVGIGLRWRVQYFVDLTLRADYAKALQTDNSIVTLTTSASF